MWTYLSNALFFVTATPAIVRAAWRLRRLAPGRRLDQLAVDMRNVETSWGGYLADPNRLEASVDRWLACWHRCRPAATKGRCLQRSLMLLDLWTRCGLRPSLQLGTVKTPHQRHFHAWVTSPDGPSSGAGRHQVIWVG